MNRVSNKSLFMSLFVIVFFAIVAIFSSTFFPIQNVDAAISGTGTQDDPFVISSVSDLQDFSDSVNDGTYSNELFSLSCDIDCGGAVLSPIGTFSHPFTGKFDGKGYTISNFTISSASDNIRVGFFGTTWNGAVIKNVGIENATFTGSNVSAVSGDSETYFGGLVADAHGTTIENSFVVNGEETTSSIEISSSISSYVGGLVGSFTNGSIKNSYASLSISFSSLGATNTNFVGGLVGKASDMSIENCYSYSQLSVSSTSQNLDNVVYVGGIVGFGNFPANLVLNNFSLSSIIVADELSEYHVGIIFGKIHNDLLSHSSYQNKIDFCHYIKTETVNSGLNPLGDGSIALGYSFGHFESSYFSSIDFFKNTEYWNVTQSDIFDFENIWLLDSSSFPSLQSFAIYEISIELGDPQLYSLSISGVEDRTTNVKYGEVVTINCVINSNVASFYQVDGWKRNQSLIDGESSLSISFVCSNQTAGEYAVVLKAKVFTINVGFSGVEGNANSSYGSFSYKKFAGETEGSFSRSFTTAKTITAKYGDTIMLKASPNSNYAFDKWEALDPVSGFVTSSEVQDGILRFNVGSNSESLPFEELALIYTFSLSFTRDISLLSVDFDSFMGQIKIGNDDFSAEEIKNNGIKLGSQITLEAKPMEGYEFVGWFSDAEHENLLSDTVKLEDYTCDSDSELVFAHFQLIDDGKSDGLSGWAIFGIVAGSVVFVAGVVLLIVFLVRRGGRGGGHGSYKRSFKNFGY